MRRLHLTQCTAWAPTLLLALFVGCHQNRSADPEDGAGGAAAEPEPIAPPRLVEPDCGRCANGWCRIEPGTFTMGAPFDEPTRGAVSVDPVEVTLTRPFEVMQHEVTVGEWLAVGLALSELQTECTDANCPVQTTWYEALLYANLRSEKHEPPLEPCYALSGCAKGDGKRGTVCEEVVEAGPLYDCSGFRLPSEAEWEYACRAGTTTAFYSGPVTVSAVEEPHLLHYCYDEPNLEPIAWYCTNSGDVPHPVGGKWANPWCLFDMSGNVAEWTNGGYDGSSYGPSPQTDPGATLGNFMRRARRGGSYFTYPAGSTCFRRGGTIPDFIEGNGLRLVRTLPASP